MDDPSRLDPRFDAYVDPLPPWQQAICRRVRELALAADPDVVETIKRTVQPYYVLQGNVCALLAAKGWVNVFIYSALVDDPTGLITGGQQNATGRTMSIRDADELDAEPFTAILRQVIANNRAGRKASTGSDPGREVPVPPQLRAELEATSVSGAFDGRPYYQRKHWVDSITSAKKPETRERRTAAMIQALRTGKVP